MINTIHIYIYIYIYLFLRVCVHVRTYSSICISSKPLNPHIHVYTNMRSLRGSWGFFLTTSIVVSNSVIHLYTQIRICLYVSWTEWVGPLRYSLIRSYWLSQTGLSTQNRSVLAYYSKQLLPSYTETQLWDPVSLWISPSETVIISRLPVPYAYYLMIHWPVISLWSLIISHLYWFILDRITVP